MIGNENLSSRLIKCAEDIQLAEGSLKLIVEYFGLANETFAEVSVLTLTLEHLMKVRRELNNIDTEFL
ncbi:hypothetical protein G3M83_07135 [Rouxiella badensis]|uniref:hypothetical protein n=1 Tax=Rouxiella badensis TaxID=1646377 RepID=UPI0013EF5503|nr:hypothetical protein [Rouxiella badensis]QII37486.1 hypothetical protein G3M83_07135 [Rouxiella badensis]